MERATSGASLLSLWFPNVQPNNKSNTIVIEFTIISGTLITVLTDRIRFISWDLIPGSSPNPPIPWSVPQPMFLRKRSSCSTAMAFTHSRAACSREYRVKAMVTPDSSQARLTPSRTPPGTWRRHRLLLYSYRYSTLCMGGNWGTENHDLQGLGPRVGSHPQGWHLFWVDRLYSDVQQALLFSWSQAGLKLSAQWRRSICSCLHLLSGGTAGMHPPPPQLMGFWE